MDDGSEVPDGPGPCRQLTRGRYLVGSSLTLHMDPQFDQKHYIFHYTYGIEYTLKGRPQGINQIGERSPRRCGAGRRNACV